MVGHEIPAIVRKEPEGRTAHIAKDEDGGTIGVALFFTPEELAAINAHTAAADAVELQIKDGEMNLVPICLKTDETK